MEVKETEKIDVTPYIGTKVQIIQAIVEESKFGKVVKLVSNPVGTLPNGEPLTASTMLGFSKDKEGNHFIGKDTKMHKFINSKKIDVSKIPDEPKVGDEIDVFLGIEVIAQKNDKDFLTFT